MPDEPTPEAGDHGPSSTSPLSSDKQPIPLGPSSAPHGVPDGERPSERDVSQDHSSDTKHPERDVPSHRPSHGSHRAADDAAGTAAAGLAASATPDPGSASSAVKGPKPSTRLLPAAEPTKGEPIDRTKLNRTADGRSGSDGPRRPRARQRKVRRVVRRVEPWSVLKLSLLFYAAVFLIFCVASALLWGTARSSGAVDNVESFITSVGGFGNCEPIDGEAPTTTTTQPGPTVPAPVDQIDPAGSATTDLVDPGTAADEPPADDEDCREGEHLVGEFKFEDSRIFQAFVLGGIVLVLAGAAANVVLVLLFNLMSDLTGGIELTVLEDDASGRSKRESGSPPSRRRD